MEYVIIGKITNTFGIKGELKVKVHTDFVSERFKNGTSVYLGENKDLFIVKRHYEHKGFLNVSFEDIDNINQVEKYKNQFIYKAKKDIMPLKKGEYYFSDLIDLDIYADNKKIGTVIKVEEGIKSNYLRVLKDVDHKEALIPYIEYFILNVDLKEKRIDINNIEGLL